jgi:hypothetical protein
LPRNEQNEGNKPEENREGAKKKEASITPG